MDKLLEALGLALAQVRARRDMSQHDLSVLSGVSQPAIASWENGQKAPRLDLWLQVLQALKVTPDELLAEAQADRLPPAKDLHDLGKMLDEDELASVIRFARWQLAERRERYNAGG